MTSPDPPANAFEREKPGTPARDRAEGRIEGVRDLGGVFVEAVGAARMPMVLTDPALPGDPILFANQAFLGLSGYTMDEVLGQQPHFMNGADTDPEDAARFRAILAEDRDEVIETVQYAKDGRRFVAAVVLSAFKDAGGRTLHHFLTWTDVTRRVEAERTATRLRAENEELVEQRARDAAHAFLLGLSDALRPLATGRAQRTAACALLGRHLGAERAFFLTFDPERNVAQVDGDYAEGELPSLAGDYRPEGFRRACARLSAGDTWAVEDAEREPAISAAERRTCRELSGRSWIAVPLIKDGVLEAALCVVSAVPRAWTEAEIALTEETAQRSWEAVARSRAEDAIRKGEHYRLLFDSIDEGFCVIELVFDAHERPVDFVFLEINRAFERQSGFAPAVGQSMRQIAPDHEQYWFDAYGEVALTGAPKRFEAEAGALRRWYDVYAVRVGPPEDRRVAVVFRDQTERRRAELALRESEALRTAMLDVLPLGLALIDLAGRVVLSNAEWLRFVPTNLVPSHDPERRSRWRSWDADGNLVPPEGFPAARALRGEQVSPPLEFLYRHDDGQEMWTSVAAVPFRDGAGAVVGAVTIIENVDEARRAVEALRESEQRFREFGENSSDALWIVDAHTRRLEFLSPAFTHIWGQSRRAVMDDLGHWTASVHPDDRAAAEGALPRVLAGLATIAEYRIIRPDGEVRWIRDTGFPISDNGVVKRAAGIAQDVTDLKRTEIALRDSNERLSLAIEVGQFATWDWDLQTRTVTWNDRHHAILGYAAGEVPASFAAWLARVHPEDRAEAVTRIEAARDGRHQFAHDFRVLHPDGTVRWCAARGRFFYDRHGAPYRMIGVMEDATERTLAERALRESEERLRAIVENADDYAIFTTDPDGIVNEWLEGAEKVFGYSREEIAGNSCDVLFTPEDRAAGEPERERATAAAQGKAGDVRWHLRKDGSRVFIDGVSTALRSDDGALTGFLKIGQDVTEKHAAAGRQALLLAELQHRVRNTLGMIRSMIRFTAGGHDHIEDFLNHLIGRIDALSRTQQLLTRDPDARIDLHELVGEEIAAQAGGRHGHALDGPRVTLSAKAAEVLSLALHELATNSVKYGALGAVPPSGPVKVGWQVMERDGQPWLELEWREPVEHQWPPPTPGFGTELITRRVPYELGGEARLSIADGWAEAHIAFPLIDRPSALETRAPEGLVP